MSIDGKTATDMDLFVEVFPVRAEAVPELAAYTLATTGDLSPAARDRLGGRLAARFRKAYDGLWRWLDGLLVTDAPRSAAELNIAADLIRAESPARFEALDAIHEAGPVSARVQAQIVVREQVQPLRDSIRAVLRKAVTRLRNAAIERDHRVQAWDVGGSPALSLTIASRLVYGQDLAGYIGETEKRVEVADLVGGLTVSQKDGPRRGEITGVLGQLGKERARLLDAADEHTTGLLLAAPDTDWVVSVRAGQEAFALPASALNLIVRVPDIGRFDIDRAAAIEALQMQPNVRAGHVRAISDVLKSAGIIDSAYNSRTTPERFLSADFEMNLRFGDTGGVAKRVRPYRAATLPDDFAQCGAYHIRGPFAGSGEGEQPLRVCVVNTLNVKLEDFVEALQRAIARSFAFTIEIVRERRVRVVSRSNLESAIRVVEKEDPDIILAFFPDDDGAGDDDDSGDEEATAAYVRSLTLGRALPVHIITESTLHDPDAMSRIILSMLGKTGSAPFVLAEPLEGVDLVVGLSLVRETKKTTGETRLVAIARIYRADGAFVRYSVRDLTQTSDDSAPPYVLVRDLFPQRETAGKRVLLHHDGPLPDDLAAALAGWSQAIRAAFFPVEIHRFGAPRLYGLQRGVTRPAWGSAFKFNEQEALLVSGVPAVDITPQPVRIVTRPFAGNPPFPIAEALRGVLVWSLLAYGAKHPPKLPVTVVNVDQLAYWLRRGNAFSMLEGRVPFWL